MSGSANTRVSKDRRKNSTIKGSDKLAGDKKARGWNLQSDGTKDPPMVTLERCHWVWLLGRDAIFFCDKLDGKRWGGKQDHIQNTNCFLMKLALLRKKDT